MAGSPHADWLAAMRAATVDVVVHCSIALSGTTMDFHNWASGGLDSTITGDPLLSSLTSVTQQVDPIKRHVQASELSLELVDDDKIRGLVASQNFLNSVVTIKLGTPSILLSRFVLVFKGTIVRLQPTEGKITIKVEALESMVRDGTNMRTYFNVHPFEVIDQMLQDSGVDSGDIDSTSFTPSTYSADISHYCFSSLVTGSDSDSDLFWDFNVGGTQTAAGLAYVHDWTYHVLRFRPFVDEVLMLTRSCMFVNTEGKVALKHFDASDAVDKHFTTDEYSDFQQLEQDVAIYNKMDCAFRASGPQRFVQQDDTSITNYEEQIFETPVVYLAPYSKFWENSSGVPYAGDLVPGFAGVKDLVTSQSTEAPSSDRPVYWLHRQEVIKAIAAFTPSSGSYSGAVMNRYGNTTGAYERYARYITMNSETRAFAGNESGAGEWDNKVWDLTATYDFTNYVLTRFSNTAPSVRITTTLEFAYLEIGDLVSLDNDLFLSPELALDGLDSSVKFEIVSRDITPLGDSVGIELELVYATKTSPPSTSLVSQIADLFETMMPSSILDAVDVGLVGKNSVGAGFDIGTGSGLNGAVGAGSASVGGQFAIGLAADTTFPVTAERDNYVGINGLSGAVIVTDVATSDPEPPLGPAEVRLGLAVAGASSISSVTDLRQIGCISEGQIDKNMIAPGMTILWNPSFDVWPDTGSMPPGWEDGVGVVGTDIVRSDTTKAGRYSLSAPDTSTSVRFKSSKFPVDPLKTYRISFWMKQLASFTMITGAFWYQADRTASGVTTSSTIYSGNNGGNTAWFQRSLVVTPPSDAAYCALDLSRSLNPGNTCYWDEFQFREELPSFVAYAPATVNIDKDDPVAIVDYGSEDYDIGANFSSSKFLAPANGLYQFECQTYCTSTSAFTFGDYAEVYFRHTDTAGSHTEFGRVEIGAANGSNLSIASVATKELLQGEIVAVFFQIVGSDATLNNTLPYTWFSGRQLS